MADTPSRIPEKPKLGGRFLRPSVAPAVCSGHASSPSRPSKHPVGRSAVSEAVPLGSCKFFLELFSGSGSLSRAVMRCGVP